MVDQMLLLLFSSTSLSGGAYKINITRKFKGALKKNF